MTKYSTDKLTSLLDMVEKIDDPIIRLKIYINMKEWVEQNAIDNIQKQILEKENRN
jgi:TPP-dependent pyruvate/acetoin dehydrogenase alpha subunit